MRKVFERYLKKDEERALLARIKLNAGREAARDHAWIRAMLATGLRVQAFASLDASDAMRACATSYLTVTEKGQRAHTVYVTAKGVKAFRDLLRARTLFTPARDGALVMSRKNRRMSVRGYQDRIAHWAKAANIDLAVSPHWLRHTRAKRIMALSTAQDPQAIVQVVLGHQSRDTTAIYTFPDREEIELAMEEAS